VLFRSSHLENNGFHIPTLNGTIYFIANYEQGPAQPASNEYEMQTIPTLIETVLIILVVMLWLSSLIVLYRRYSIISQSRNRPYQSYYEAKKPIDAKRANSMAPTHIIIEPNEEKSVTDTDSTSLPQQVNNASSKLLQNSLHYPALTTDNSLEVNTNSYSESFASSCHSHINKKLFSASRNHHNLRSLDENHLSFSTNDSFLKRPRNLSQATPQALAKSAPNSSNALPERHHCYTEHENRYNLFDVSLTALHQYQQHKQQKMRQKTFKLLKTRSQYQSNSRSKLLSEDMSTVSLKYNPSTNQTSSFLRKLSTPNVPSFHSKSSSFLAIPQSKATRQINPVSSMKRRMFVNSRNNKFFAQTTNNDLTTNTTLSNSNQLLEAANEELDGTIEERSEKDESVEHFQKPSRTSGRRLSRLLPVVRQAFMDLHRKTTISKSDSNIRRRKSPSPVSVLSIQKYASCKETRCKKQFSLQETNEHNNTFGVSVNYYGNSIETSVSKLNDENLTA